LESFASRTEPPNPGTNMTGVSSPCTASKHAKVNSHPLPIFSKTSTSLPSSVLACRCRSGCRVPGGGCHTRTLPTGPGAAAALQTPGGSPVSGGCALADAPRPTRSPSSTTVRSLDSVKVPGCPMCHVPVQAESDEKGGISRVISESRQLGRLHSNVRTYLAHQPRPLLVSCPGLRLSLLYLACHLAVDCDLANFEIKVPTTWRSARLQSYWPRPPEPSIVPP
jgi:hypothetical protein